MRLDFEAVSAWVNCRLKGYLSLVDEPREMTEFESLTHDMLDRYRKTAFDWLASSAGVTRPDQLTLDEFVRGRCRLAFNVTAGNVDRSLAIDAIERVKSTATGRGYELIPVIVSPHRKLERADLLTAAILGTALSSWQSLPINRVRIVHGADFSSTKISLIAANGRPTNVAKQASSFLKDFEAIVATGTRPSLHLNQHCQVCRYQRQCQTTAADRDDLSLLRGLQPKEIAAWNERGIFTVTQLAHTFRGKTIRTGCKTQARHSQQLQALAIREKRTFVRVPPELPSASTKVYLDVEGLPNEDYYYLIGAVIETDAGTSSHQFWADDPAHEREIWQDFFALLSQLDDCVIIHFGKYERNFLATMSRRYGTEAALCLCDVHAAVRTNVYFPVYSNRLKDLAGFVGISWAGPVRSGTDSIVWRYRWEESKDAGLKDDLLRYNYEDCEALRAVFRQLESVVAEARDRAGSPEEVTGDRRHRFGRPTTALPEFTQINQRAYFTYQRDKVYFRTDKSVRHSSRRRNRLAAVAPRVNEVVVTSPSTECPKCKGTRIASMKSSRAVKVVKDLKFTRSGVKRWVVKYETQRFSCRSCGNLSYSPQYPTGAPFFGRHLASWAVYQHVASQQAFAAVAQTLNDLFGYSFSDNLPRRAQTLLADTYKPTEQCLMARLCSGNMICIDEAQIQLRRGLRGYVWVFSGPEIAVYRFSRNRDDIVVSDALKGFSGVAVTDFYGVYDSLPCPQQKCLVHLIRDINDDLLKHPFDTELKDVASRFTALMVPIIDCIDRFGLKKRHLGKFAKQAGRYCEWLERQCFTSKPARHYQDRVAKYGERLFTFLLYDGVPWNNNLAENGVKLIASRRKLLKGLMSENGIEDYLLFLSLFQTLRRKGASFLRFLLSQKTDIFEFLNE